MGKAWGMFLAKQDRGQKEIKREAEKGRLGQVTEHHGGCTVCVWTSFRKQRGIGERSERGSSWGADVSFLAPSTCCIGEGILAPDEQSEQLLRSLEREWVAYFTLICSARIAFLLA